MRSLPQFMNSDSLLKLWKSKKDRMQGHQSAKEIADKVMPILSKELCKMHNRHVSARYWEIIIGPWVREFSVLYVDRKKVYDNVKTSNDCLFPAKDWNIYYDYGVFHSVQASHEFNSQIFSQLEYYNNLKTKIDNSVGHKEYKDIRIKFKTKRGKRLTARGKRWLIKMITTVSSIIYGSRLVVISSLSLKKEQLLALFIRSKGRIVPYLQSSISMEHDKVRHFSYDVQKDVFFQNRRNLCDNMLIEQRVEDLFIYLLIHNIPLIYIEYFLDFNEKLLPYSPYSIYVDGQHINNDILKIVVASWTENGTKLLIGQHAGADGLTDFSEIFEHELSIADIYYSWGWSVPNKNVKPLPSLRLSLFKEMYYLGSNKNILYVCRSTASTQRGTFSDTLYDIKLIKDGRRSIVKYLPQHLKNKLLIRARPGDLFDDGANNIGEFCFDNIKVASSNSSIVDLIANSSVVIFESFSTGFFECIAAGHPAVLFMYQRHHVSDNKLCVEFVSLLEEMGIVFYEAEPLVDFLEEDIEKVWSSIMNSKQWRETVHGFSLTSCDYVKELSYMLLPKK